MKDEQTEKLAGQPAPEPSSALNQCLNKFNQSIKDESKIQRKNALESIKKQLIEFFRNPNASIQFTSESLEHILNQVLNLFTDPMERCREISCEITKLLMEKNQSWDLNMTGMVIMCVFQRLGGKDIKETSEEIRLQLYTLIHELILAKCSSQKNTFEIHLQEFIAILVNSFADSFPEVKKMGCACAKLLANRLAKSNFHMQSESLVKPMLNNMTHQHSRVRKDVIECLCDVVMYGNNKSVSDVVPHLAQRLFDQANIVRVAVIKLVGTWLLDLPDRYSFHYKLIPLLLTGFIDESPEIKELTESLWWDVGIKYEKENETELKDKLDFMEIQIANYPDEFKNQRPNVGCRELIRLNASKILPGILNDISDWVEATRIKSIQLLYVMIWQAEKNTTQHLETALQTLFKASNENVHIIQDYIFNCSRLIGVFTDADLCLPVAFKTVKKLNSVNSGAINLINGLLVGCGIDKITPNLGLECLELLEDICKTYDNKLNHKALNCCATIAPLIQKENSELDAEKKNKLEYILFKVLSTISALAEEEELKMRAKEVVKNIDETKVQSLKANFLNELKCNCESWTDNAFEPNIFCFLLKEQEVSEKILGDIMAILKKCLNPSKDVKMRTKFLLMIPEVFSSICKSSDKTILETCLEDILNEMIMPNIVWKAGRSAGALRMTACASLVLLMKNEALKTINLSDQSIDKLLKMMLSSLDDDNKSTRLYVSRVFIIILNNYGKSLDKDQLHKFYPEFIKRLDDQSEEIRVEILKIFYLYFSCLNQNYDKILYQAHLQVIYENLLLYLDDTNEDFQLKILDILKHGSILNPELLIQEIKKVKEKHRNKKLCEDLEMCCQKNIEANF